MTAPTAPARSDLPSVPVPVSAGWGFAEATLFFLVPDIAIGWASLGGVRRGVVALAAAVAGAVAGGIVMYLLAAAAPAAMRATVDGVPFVTPAMFESVEAGFREWGALGMIPNPLGGIPYKVYAVLAPEHVGILAFALLTVPARIVRIAATWAGFTLAGVLFRPLVLARRRTVAVLYALFWIGLYAVYWSSIN